MKLVGAGARNSGDYGAGHAAILGGEVAGLYAKLFQRVRIGQRVSIVADAGHVASTIQVKADHGNTAVNAAVDHHLRGRHADLVIGRAVGIAVAGVGSSAGAVGLHPGRQRKFRIRVAVHQRQPDDLGGLHSSSQRRGRGFHQRWCCRYRDRLARSADGQRHIQRLRLIDGEHDILLHKLLEAGHVYLDVVLAYRKILNTVSPVRRCCGHAGESGISIGCFYAGSRDHRALFVLDRSHDGAGNLLSSRLQGRNQNQQAHSHDRCKFRAVCCVFFIFCFHDEPPTASVPYSSNPRIRVSSG